MTLRQYDNLGALVPVVAVPDRSAFGEALVAQFTPQVQLQFPYTINSAIVRARANQSGAVDVNANMLRLQTGAAANSSGEMLSRRPIKYNPGQGGVCKFTAVFTTGVPNSTQIAGVGDSGDGYFFGYDGATFGVRIRKGGVAEIRTLTITTESADAENITITLDDDAKSVAVTDATIPGPTTTANEIAAADYSDVGRGWDAYAVGPTVVFVSWCAAARTGTYSLSGATSAVGTFAQTLAGGDDTETIIPQTSWNRDKADGSGKLPVIDFTKGNVFRILYQWLGFGPPLYYIEHPVDGDLHLVHAVEYSNANTTPSVNNPTLPLYAGVLNVSNTSNLTLSAGSMTGGTHGKVVVSGPRHGTRTSKSAFAVAPVETPVLTIRNKLVYSGVMNRVHAILGLLGLAQESTKTTSVILTRNATLTGAVFADVDSNSTIEVDSTASAMSGGEVIGTDGIAKVDKTDIPRPDPPDQLAPGDTMTISIIPKSANPEVNAEANWTDDF